MLISDNGEGTGVDQWDDFEFAMYSKRRVWCAPGFYYATEPLLCGGDQRPSQLTGYDGATGRINSDSVDHDQDNPTTGGGYNQQVLHRCTAVFECRVVSV